MDTQNVSATYKKREFVLEVAAVQNFGGNRVEKSFSQLGLEMVHQQADVVQLHLLPNFHGLVFRLEFGFQSR